MLPKKTVFVVPETRALRHIVRLLSRDCPRMCKGPRDELVAQMMRIMDDDGDEDKTS